MNKSFSSVFAAAAFISSLSPVLAADLHELPVVSGGEPRAFFFRQSEGLARSGRLPFENWEKTFLRLDGIMGKTLDEEVPGTQSPNIPFFTRFKQAHPKQAVLLHFNGNARDPRWECGGFFAGHWLYFNGCRVTADVPAQPGEAVITIEDPSLFRVNMGRYGDKNEDIGLCALGDDGKPDWSRSEQLELLAVDAKAKTLRVKRGAFGTAPRAFAASKAYIAAHQTEGPWGAKSNLLWFYNYSTACPRDAKGRTCSDVLVADIARRFLPGGSLAAFDGLEFDVLSFRPHGGGRGRAADTDGDGKADSGGSGGINTYGVGVYEFCRKLRGKLGDNRLIMADGHSPHSQRSFGILNGIESEGWPMLTDSEIVDWSGGLNRHEFWRLHGRAPALSYINHKFIDREAARTGGEKMLQVPLNISRLVMAAGLFTDSAFTYCIMPLGTKRAQVGIYDELRMGTANRIHWLGKPLAPPVRLALRAPDLLGGRFTQRLRPEQAKLETCDDGHALKITALKPDADKLTLTLPALALPEGDLFVHLRIKAEPMKGYPAAIPRLAWVGWRHAGDLMQQPLLAAGMTLRGQKDEPLRDEVGARFSIVDKITVAGESHRAYAVHPPYRGVTGSTFWETTAVIPADKPRLTFFSALTDKAKGKSDGVGLKIEVRRDGGAEEVLSLHHREKQWVARSADLSRWAGQTVRLRFTTDPGPAGNTVADHTFWGDVRIESGAGASAAPDKLALTPQRIMTWVGGEWFESGFYFRNLGPRTVDLTFEFEGGEPVYLTDLSAHAAADAIARDYEHGVVLANPSTRPFTFDVANLFPNAKLRRLQASPEQDRSFNDGSAVGATVTVGPRDAVILGKEGAERLRVRPGVPANRGSR
ncbi:MAG: hypothetical protein HZA91_14780 [Verrucomicrobia bacterium]|nr:hypothetical protein [Verrucomicrobiota bacterium]